MSNVSDRELYGRVRWALEKDRHIESADLIHLSVEDGIVQLWGEVNSSKEKMEAEAVARAQAGAKDVVNALTIAGTARRDGRKKMTEALESALARARGIRSKGIGIASVEHGVVRLAGRADSLAEERAAIAACAAVPGVRDVVSDVSIGDVLPADAIEVFDDAAVKGMVNSAISERGVTIYDEDTAVDGGIVRLRGRVRDPREVELAGDVAAAIPGVKDILNELIVDQIKTSRDPDQALAAKVTDALRRDGRVSPAAVLVECVGGVAWLFGSVESIDDQNAAAAVAARVAGVRRVINDIVITGRTSLGKAEQQLGRE